MNVLPFCPAEVLQTALKCGSARLSFRIIFRLRKERGDAPDTIRSLGCCRKQRSKHHRADKREKRAPPHSITSSARASSVGGTSRPSALAVLRLITNKNLVGKMTGNSAGLAPLRILSTYAAL